MKEKEKRNYIVGDQIDFLTWFPRGRKGFTHGRVIQINPDGTMVVLPWGRDASPRKVKWNGKHYERVDE